MKLTRVLLLFALLAVFVCLPPAVRAGSGCPDDPERCVERGAAVSRNSGVVVKSTISAPAVPVVLAPATPAVSASTRQPAVRRPVAKPTRSAPAPAPATPGMGMLLKLSGGMGGDVTWFPGRNVESSTASWVL